MSLSVSTNSTAADSLVRPSSNQSTNQDSVIRPMIIRKHSPSRDSTEQSSNQSINQMRPIERVQTLKVDFGRVGSVSPNGSNRSLNQTFHQANDGSAKHEKTDSEDLDLDHVIKQSIERTKTELKKHNRGVSLSIDQTFTQQINKHPINNQSVDQSMNAAMPQSVPFKGTAHERKNTFYRSMTIKNDEASDQPIQPPVVQSDDEEVSWFEKYFGCCIRKNKARIGIAITDTSKEST